MDEVSPFRGRLLNSTRGRILTRLRGGSQSVKELASALGVTHNAVRSHLVSLERDGLVSAQGFQPGVRRPHTAYALTADAEQLFPKAYGALFNQLLAFVIRRLKAPEVDAGLREVGRAVAGDVAHLYATVPSDDRGSRLAAGIRVLEAMGAAPVLSNEDGRTFIRGSHCPLSAATANHPQACLIAEGLLTEVIAAPVKACCTHAGRPSCCFDVGEASAS